MQESKKKNKELDQVNTKYFMLEKTNNINVNKLNEVKEQKSEIDDKYN